jgi:hypothetical protein
MWFGRSAGELPSSSEFFVFHEHDTLDDALFQHVGQLGDEFDAYRNHCLRVLSFAVHHLGGLRNVTNRQVNLMALALAYHDIALWTDGKLDYLDPSAALLLRDLRKNDKSGSVQDLQDADFVTLREIVLQHHKLTTWTPPEGSQADELLVNAVRKGDWADATIGMIRFGLPAAYLEKAYTELPEGGFHGILARMGGRLSPDSITERLAVLNIFKL